MTMAKLCTHCGKKKGFIEKNYAGFDVRKKGDHPFPERIKELVLPGNRKTDFFCGACASKEFIVECEQHGPISGGFAMGLPPTCAQCKKERADIEKAEV
jgi:hypothetical protein